MIENIKNAFTFFIAGLLLFGVLTLGLMALSGGLAWVEVKSTEYKYKHYRRLDPTLTFKKLKNRENENDR